MPVRGGAELQLLSEGEIVFWLCHFRKERSSKILEFLFDSVHTDYLMCFDFVRLGANCT